MQNNKKILFWICLAVVILALGFLLGWYLSQSSRGEIYEEMQQQNEKLQEEQEKEELPTVQPEETKAPVVIPVDFATLQQQNKDIYAWIQIPGTVVDYPIVQHPTDDSYYLNRTVEGRSGLPGSIYTESLNTKDFTDRNTVIYGHNMRNGSMFGDLSLYMDGSYMKEHNRVIVYTPEHMYTYQIFAAVTYDNRHILHSFDFSQEAGLTSFLDSLASVRNMNSYIDEEVSVASADKIITLSTCNGNKKQRFLVEAVLIHEQ